MFVDMTLYNGRPGEPGNRLSREIRCYDMLDRLKIPYRRADHDPADTIEACKAVEKVLGCEICKNLFLANRQQTDFYLLLTPGAKPFKTKALSKEIGTARLSFGSPERMNELLGVSPGSVSVLGLMNDREGRVRLLADRDLMGCEFLGVHPCINTSTLKIRTADIIGRFLPEAGHRAEFVCLPWETDE